MKIVLLFLILSFSSLSLAQDCNNPLLQVFGINGLQAPESGAGLPFCPNLQNGQTCCSAETVLGLQTNLNNLAQRLENNAAQKDIYIDQLNSNFTSQYQEALANFSENDNAIANLEQNVPGVGDPLRNQTNLFKSIGDALNNLDNDFSGALIAYQQTRTFCFTTLLQIQAAAWCLACDPNYALQGVQSDGTVNPSPIVCNTIQSACSPFLDDAIALNPLFQAQQTYQRLLNIRAYLDEFRANGNIAPNTTIENDILNSTNNTERTVSRPADPQWQCENLFSPQFVLNEQVAANGAGLIGGADITSLPAIGILLLPPGTETPIEETEVVPEETAIIEETVTEVTETVTEVTEVVTGVTETITEVGETITEVGPTITEVTTPGNSRLLQASAWNPDVQTTGFEVSVAPDPGNVTNIEESEVTTPLAGKRFAITGTVFIGAVVLVGMI